jgi:hypothetical protein
MDPSFEILGRIIVRSNGATTKGNFTSYINLPNAWKDANLKYVNVAVESTSAVLLTNTAINGRYGGLMVYCPQIAGVQPSFDSGAGSGTSQQGVSRLVHTLPFYGNTGTLTNTIFLNTSISPVPFKVPVNLLQGSYWQTVIEYVDGSTVQNADWQFTNDQFWIQYVVYK